MQLHEFMCPEVAPETARLRADPSPMGTYPSRLLMLCDFEHDRVHLRGPAPGTVQTMSIADTAKWGRKPAHKFIRSFDLIESLKGRVRSHIVANMRDATPYDPEFYFGHPANILQHNRRRGCRTAVLWRLPGYLVPDTGLGGTFGKDISDERDFLDKRPVIFWRGAFSGGRWLTPYWRERLDPTADPDAITAAAAWNSRARAVLYSLENRKFTDFRFTIRKKQFDQFDRDTRRQPFLSGFVEPARMLEHRYILCPAGHDFSSQLYWIIATRSIAFKEEIEYEVLPDYFLKPWVHYVPVAPGLTDLREKFNYCEANPDVCRAIIERANEAYRRILRPAVWAEAEATVLDRLGVAA